MAVGKVKFDFGNVEKDFHRIVTHAFIITSSANSKIKAYTDTFF